jgi:hypothetical protein
MRSHGAWWGARDPRTNMKTMWDGRCRLSVGTKGGKVLLGLDLRSLRLGPAATFFEGALPTPFQPSGAVNIDT